MILILVSEKLKEISTVVALEDLRVLNRISSFKIMMYIFVITLYALENLDLIHHSAFSPPPPSLSSMTAFSPSSYMDIIINLDKIGYKNLALCSLLLILDISLSRSLRNQKII